MPKPCRHMCLPLRLRHHARCSSVPCDHPIVIPSAQEEASTEHTQAMRAWASANGLRSLPTSDMPSATQLGILNFTTIMSVPLSVPLSVLLSVVNSILVRAVLLGPCTVAVWLRDKPCWGHVRVEDTNWLMYKSATGPLGFFSLYNL